MYRFISSRPHVTLKKNRSEMEKRFGIQIDSLNDLVCFGVLPAAIGWSTGCSAPWFLATMSFFALCALIRLAYFEHPDYVPLLRRAYARWRDLEAESGRR